MQDLTRPANVSFALVELLEAGDFDGTVDLYEPSGVFVDLDGTVPAPSVAATHRAFVEAGNRLVLGEAVTFTADDIALVHWSWTVETPDGTISGTSAEVLRRRPDGTWRFVIDNSDGAAHLGRPGSG